MLADCLEITVRVVAPDRDARAEPAEASEEAQSEVHALSKDDGIRFRRLVNEQFDIVWRFLRGLGVPDAGCDDAAQHVFWVTSRRLSRVTPGSERAFLFSTARGVAANARRAEARRREVSDETALNGAVDPTRDPEQLASSAQARRKLDSFLDALPEEMRAVFILFELEGMTMAAIASLLAIPPGTVASRLRRAREAFHVAAARANGQEGGAP